VDERAAAYDGDRCAWFSRPEALARYGVDLIMSHCLLLSRARHLSLGGKQRTPCAAQKNQAFKRFIFRRASV